MQDNYYYHCNGASPEALHLFVGGRLSAAGEKMKTKVQLWFYLLLSKVHLTLMIEPNNRVMNDGGMGGRCSHPLSLPFHLKATDFCCTALVACVVVMMKKSVKFKSLNQVI